MRPLGFLAALVIVAAAVLIVLAARRPLIFAPPEMLGALWQTYKKLDLEPGTFRTIDRTQGNITTSEGESYTMLRAAWMGDRATFDTSWQWTKDNLHRSDNLFAWLFGERADGTYGVLTSQGGEHAASDADTDIALALTFAYARWQDPQYLAAAKGIVGDIWGKEVIEIRGTPYLAADDLEKTSKESYAVINPSYLNPAAYRIFALIDPAHPWSQLVDSSYQLLSESMSATYGGRSAKLPPDWVHIDKQSGALLVPVSRADSNFGYDALRVPFRLALDYAWYGDARDKGLLEQMSFLAATYEQQGMLVAIYSHAGAPLVTYQSPALYGASLGYFMNEAPADGAKLYTHLISSFDPNASSWEPTLSYYDDNWMWFGVGLYNNLLPNLAASLPAAAYQ